MSDSVLTIENLSVGFGRKGSIEEVTHNAVSLYTSPSPRD